jgi:predicted methyltransferase|tara:strand:- start:70 stop:447 length:378 start_codon:yes stop_codon:yes gene_type:complete
MSIGNTRRTYTVLSFAPNDVVAADSNETGVDLQDYEGDITLILDAEAGGSGVTYAVKVQDSADNSSFADVTDAAFTTTTANTALVESLVVNTDEIRRYARVVIDVTGSSPAGAVSVVGLGRKKYD